MARPPVAPPSPSFSPAGSIPLILYIHKSDRLIRFVEYAGSEGIEPPIEVLETPGIPFTYEPSGRYCIKICRGWKSAWLTEFDGGDKLVKGYPKSRDKYVKLRLGVRENKLVDLRAVFCRGVMVKVGRRTS